MNSKEAFLLIDMIAATSSKNEKQALVSANIEDKFFKDVLISALDPLISYGISKRPSIETNGDGMFEAYTWEIITQLECRELTGNAAIDTVRTELARLEPASSELFWRIIKKDLRAGFSAETVNKAKKGTIRSFPYMRCVLPEKAKFDKFDKWDWKAGAFSQHKADGAFTNVDHDHAGVVRLTTRQGNELPIEKFPALEHNVKKVFPMGTQTHGEIVVLVDGVVASREVGNGILNSVLAGGDFEPNQKPVFFAWDQIPLDVALPKGKCDTPYRERFKGLLKQLVSYEGTSVRLIPTKIVKSLDEAYAHCASLQIEGKEGTVIKNGSGIWKDTSSGNPDVVKLKLEIDVDLESFEILDGEAGTKNEGRAGRVGMRTRDDKLRVYVAVKNEALRDAIDADREAFIGHVWPVRFNEVMYPSDSNPLHSLFLPRMAEAGYRTDKDVADSLEEVLAARANAVTGKKVEEALAA
jgi:DNA ligase-1